MSGDDPVVDDEVILLPGNHDHLTWDYARQRWLEDRLVAAGGRLDGSPSHRIGPMLLDREPAIISVPLTALLRASARRPAARVRVLYPDLCLPSADGRRLVWSRTATTSTRCAPACPSSRACSRRTPSSPRTPRRWSAKLADRSFFSSMTRSGRPGELVELIYEALQDEQAFKRILDAVARNVTIDQGRLKGGAERWTIRHVAGGLAGKLAAARERGDQSGVLSPGARKALGTYIGALLQRVQTDLGELPDDASLILGHTHKPFAEWWADDAWPAGGIGVVNTGGWVVDHRDPRPLEGGAVALVDDDLNVALVRLYQQVDDPSAWSIAVETANDLAEAFADRLRGQIDTGAPPWSTFAASAAGLVLERRRELETALAEELRDLDT